MNSISESQSYHHVRRVDRAKDDDWIRDYLKKAPFGVLGTSLKNQPFHNINLFAYDPIENVIYIHTAREGRTPTNIAINPQVCFSTGEMGRLLPADTAIEFSVEYASVIVFGTAEIIADAAEAQHGLQLLLDKYFPHLAPERDYRGILPEEVNKTAVYRIIIHSWSGKQKSETSEFPGAFYFGEKQTSGDTKS